MKRIIFLIFVLGVCSFSIPESGSSVRAEEKAGIGGSFTEMATFAGGCFWCMVPPFKKLDGVLSVTSGYTGGHLENPRYEQVSAGGTGHAESVQIVYDPQKISYQRLLEVFWHNVDPTVVDQQFCDIGNQYRSEIFYHSDLQKKWAEESKATLEKTKPFKNPIVTQITAASKFYPAEKYHQDFFSKNPIRYRFYRHHCGRDQRLEELWGKSAPAH
ncbi:MAG: peptide-methionine (S)-S-oxide reductase MsrA [Nitrospirae bacterium]|nr:peptide-methionine (S)-S-oxide reductase MsrA [Nitrospirota bacterium]MBI3595113.1 peptide-methionine (S)-S-oxide reductase MsrA [Nitrospirota bacterium]